MDTLRTRPAAGTGVRLAYMPDGDHGRRAVTDSARYLKAMRDEGGWSKGLLHHVDSFVKPTRVGAHTSSKLSQSPFWKPIDTDQVHGGVFAGALGPEDTAHWFVAPRGKAWSLFRPPLWMKLRKVRHRIFLRRKAADFSSDRSRRLDGEEVTSWTIAWSHNLRFRLRCPRRCQA